MKYAWDADRYERHASPQHQWARDLITTLTFAGDEHVLDIGCGNGKVTAELAARVPSGSVVGVDASRAMIRFAQEKFPSSRFPNLRFQCGDATRLTFHDEFDLIVSFASLHWVHDHRAVLQGIKRALKPEGKAVLQFGGEGNVAPLAAAVTELISREPWRRYFVGFTFPWSFCAVAPYRELINEVGLSITRIELVPKDMAFGRIDAFEGWIDAVFLPYLERLPNTQRAAFTRELVALYLTRQPPDMRGFTHVPIVRLEVEATR